MQTKALLLAALGLAGSAVADPTWPSSVDELEELMFQLNSFKARKFADTVSPCSNEASGPGRQNAAEWLRSAFHDMSTANTYFKTGGLDGSLQYELENGENTGTGHRTTLEFMAKYISPRSSLSDLIAAGVYMSVRSCGGPIVPIRAGRVDATAKGNTGVPQPQNSAFTFQQQFDRMGFNNVEMIQVTACGHTLGGVHTDDFPDLVPAGSVPNGLAGLDSTVAAFDNRVITEYLAGNTTNPLVVGPSVQLNKHADFKVFNSDSNTTVQSMTDSAKFRDICKNVLQKMVEVVPPGVNLTDPIVPYNVKPVELQLTLADGGASLHFTGFIRVKTTDLPVDSITDVTLTYKNRAGTAECGSSGCEITSTVQGVSQGFDDTFAFFPIDAKIPVSTGISSFVLSVNHVDGTKQPADNNGNGYPIQDKILFQRPQSCVLGSTGAATLVAAVHNDALADGAKATISYRVAQSNSPVPSIKTATVELAKGNCIGKYTLFTIDQTIEGGMAYQSYVDFVSGDKSDSFKSLATIGGTCQEFQNPIVCDAVEPPTTTSDATTPPTDVTTTPTDITSTPTDATTTPTDVTTLPTETTETPTITPTTSSSPAPSPYHRSMLGSYTMLSCWAEGAASRALTGASTAEDEMTLEKCMEFCSGYNYWGTEYGRECYCGNKLNGGSEAVLEQCNMVCGGNASQYCGAGNRLELYSTTATITTPTGTLMHLPTVSAYSLVGCWTEGVGTRALDKASTEAADMTNEKCADFCQNYRYFGTEYGSECYCGSYLADSSESATLDECNMVCGGDQFQYCGASNRLELYMNPNITGGTPEQPPAAGEFVLLGCQTEGNGTRALADDSLADDNMSNEACANYCKDYEYFGTEYGRECYCGNTLAPSSLEAPKTECRITCAGNNLEYCGGSNRLSVYQKKEELPPTNGTESG